MSVKIFLEYGYNLPDAPRWKELYPHFGKIYKGQEAIEIEETARFSGLTPDPNDDNLTLYDNKKNVLVDFDIDGSDWKSQIVALAEDIAQHSPDAIVILEPSK
jgi:hypothetical protein